MPDAFEFLCSFAMDLPPLPSYAYVVYKDGAKAVVAVTLIKDFRPASVKETARDKMVYWRKQDASDDENEEGFYPADVEELGCK